MLLASGGVLAQSSIGVTVGLSQPGPLFYVDGQQYSSAQVFLWPTGSTHILQFPFSVIQGVTQPYQSSTSDTARWTFSGWTDNLGLLASFAGAPVVTITVVEGLTSVIGSVTELFELSVVFPTGTGSGGTNPGCSLPPSSPTPGLNGWGLVFIDTTYCFSDSGSIYVPAGTVTLAEFPFPGYGFLGFQVGGNPPNPSLTTFNLTQPGEAITAYFSPAKLVSFRTSPLALQVTVDDVTINTPPSPPTSVLPSGNSNPSCTPNYAALPVGTPAGITPLCIGDFDFLPGSSHKIGAPPTQQDSTGAWWVFSAFSDGIGQNGTYVTNSATNVPDAVIADFIPGMQSAIVTNPSGLKISIDGTTAWTDYNFIWAQGTTHTLSAPLTQVDSSGRTWQFANWSNGGAASQTITVPSSPNSGTGFILTANYTLQGQVQVTSSPAGLTFTVGGTSCTTPCAVNQPSGTQLQISIPASVALSATSQLQFTSWSGGSASTATSLQVTLTQAATVYTANYQTYYLLTASSNPANEATLRTSPASPNGFFPSGTQIAVTAVPNAGYKFVGWGGDLSGAASPGYLTMSAPHSVVAVLQAVPLISPAGIINAAGPTPDGTVAPGSLISIYGQNLAGTLQVGPSDPLAQTVGNVTVTVNNMLMPLLFVSSGQINAQVPNELTPGTYTLTVQSAGQAPVFGSFTVSRDAPGIFTEANAQNIPLAAALHQDGSEITLASPALPNEIVSLYGTGLGPLNQMVGDGFAAPNTPLDPVTDPVTVTVNASSVPLPATWAGAAPGIPGVAIVQFQIPSSISSGTNANIMITVGGKPSATVQLPVQ
jgi:uncharacterized protein (TIGR03437 family)